MHTFKFVIFILSVLLIIACNDASSNKASQRIEQEPKPKESVNNVTNDLTKYGIANNPENVLGGLKKGEKAPDFSMLDQDGKEISLENKLLEGPVLLVFLRAEWCSFCVRHLQEFQANIQEIHDAGEIQVLAISPQEKSYMQKLHRDNQFSFPILHDIDHSAMKDYKVFFHVTNKYNDYIEKAKGKRIEVFNGNSEAIMPIPATYLIDQNKIIKYVHYDPDYKKRSDVKKVIATF